MRDGRINQKAFSLVELAIVLAIIGLIAGGVMATTSYLRTAKLTTTLNEGKLYLNGLKQFQAKYDGGLPGDLGNASAYWTGAFNGDGNGMIQAVNTGGNNEIFPAFVHLQLAGFIGGKYSGVQGPAGLYDAVIGSNAPALSMEGVTGILFTPFANGGYSPGTGAYYAGYYGTIFQLTKELGAPSGGFLTPSEAYEVDNKLDDGQPDKGWIRTPRNAVNCVGGGTSYLATSTTNACNLILIQL